jgi:hypothetical protein
MFRIKTQGSPLILPIESCEFADEVISTAYHNPYLDEEQKERDRCFWIGFHSSVISGLFHTRAAVIGMQHLDEIQNLLIN